MAHLPRDTGRTRDDLLKTHDTCCAAAKKIMVGKNEDYTGPDGKDPLANFCGIENLFGGVIQAEGSITGRMSDKVIRLSNLCGVSQRDPSVQDESVMDSCLDIINLAVLLIEMQVMRSYEANGVHRGVGHTEGPEGPLELHVTLSRQRVLELLNIDFRGEGTIHVHVKEKDKEASVTKATILEDLKEQASKGQPIELARHKHIAMGTVTIKLEETEAGKRIMDQIVEDGKKGSKIELLPKDISISEQIAEMEIRLSGRIEKEYARIFNALLHSSEMEVVMSQDWISEPILIPGHAAGVTPPIIKEPANEEILSASRHKPTSPFAIEKHFAVVLHGFGKPVPGANPPYHYIESSEGTRCSVGTWGLHESGAHCLYLPIGPLKEFVAPGEVPAAYQKSATDAGFYPGASLRPSVLWFAERMEKILSGHDEEKGGQEQWRLMSEAQLFSLLLQEVEELRETWGKDPLRTAHEATDISNFCMMIADKAMREVSDK